MALSKSEPAMRLSPIQGAQNEYDQIKHLYLNTQITRWIRNGAPWDRSKIERYLSYFRDSDYRNSGFVDYMIIVNSKVVGIVGFRPDFIPSPGRNNVMNKEYRFYLGRPFISILIDPKDQGKGYGSRALEMGIREYNELYPDQIDFYSYIALNNGGSLRLHDRVGFKQLHQIGDHILMGYSLSTERNLTDYATSLGVSECSGPIMCQKISKETLIELIMSKSIPFPYAKNFLPSPETMMEKYVDAPYRISDYKYNGFKSYHSKNSLFMPPVFYPDSEKETEYNYLSILSDHYPDYDVINGLTDHFIEDIRIRARKVDKNISTAECYGVDYDADRQCVEQIVDHVFKFFPSYEDKNLRDSVFSVSRDPGLFKIMWVRGLLNELVPDMINQEYQCRMLDISSGWGDRLIGAIAHQCQYLGFDPNTELKNGHNRIIDQFGDRRYHRVIYSPFEEADLSDELPFDICITSPPFFGIEIYSEDGNQSINKYPNFVDWITGFLFKSLEKVWDKLNYGGYLAIHMGDVMGNNINEPMLLFIEQFLVDSSYHGVIGVGGDGAIAPVWIWRKMRNPRYWIDPKGTDRTDPYRGRHLQQLYPEIFERYYQRSNSLVLSENETREIIRKMNISTLGSSQSFSSSDRQYSSQKIAEIYSELDPISQVCLVKDTFSRSVEREGDSGIDEFVNKITFSLSDEERSHSINIELKSTNREGFKPDRSLADIDKCNELKEMINYLDGKRKDLSSSVLGPRTLDRRIKDLSSPVLIGERVTNPFQGIGNSIFQNNNEIGNEAIELANVDSIFNFCQRSGGLLGPQEIGLINELIKVYPNDDENRINSCNRTPRISRKTESLTYPEPPIISQTKRIPSIDDNNENTLVIPTREIGMKYCDINPMTSGFSEYIAYRFPPDFSRGIGIYSDPVSRTENSGPWNSLGDKYKEILGNSYQTKNASDDNKGGIIIEANNLSSYIKDTLIELDIVVGSSIVRNNPLDTFFMLNSILIIALNTLKVNGSLVCKIPCVSNGPFAELIYIASIAFERIGIMKPISTNPANNEQYIVFNYPRKSQIDICIGSLNKINESYSWFKEKGLIPTKILKDNTIPQRYFDFIKRHNDLVVDLRIQTYVNIIKYLRGDEIILPEYELSRTLLTWNLPDNIKRTNILDFVIERPKNLERNDNDNDEEPLRSRENSPYLGRSRSPVSPSRSPVSNRIRTLSPGRRPSSPPRIAFE